MDWIFLFGIFLAPSTVNRFTILRELTTDHIGKNSIKGLSFYYFNLYDTYKIFERYIALDVNVHIPESTISQVHTSFLPEFCGVNAGKAEETSTWSGTDTTVFVPHRRVTHTAASKNISEYSSWHPSKAPSSFPRVLKFFTYFMGLGNRVAGIERRSVNFICWLTYAEWMV